MQGAVGADDLADPAEVRVEVNLALGLEDRGVGGHTGDGVDRGEPLDVVEIGRVEQDVHGAHPNAGPSPLHPLFSSDVRPHRSLLQGIQPGQQKGAGESVVNGNRLCQVDRLFPGIRSG